MGKNKASKAEVQATKLNQFQSNQDTEFSSDLTADAQAAFGDNANNNLNNNVNNNLNKKQRNKQK